MDFDLIAGMKFPSTAGFDGAIDFDFFTVDQKLGFTAGGHGVAEL
jgi:hypothetical protein